MSDSRIDEIIKDISEVKIEVVEIKSMLRNQILLQEKECSFRKKEIDNLMKIIEGNGKKGLKDRLDELEKFETRVISYATVIFTIINITIFILSKTIFN